jgi:hypothetical protein
MSEGSGQGRESLLTDVIALAVGIVIIFVAIGRLGNQIVYLPDDARAQPGVNVAISAVMVIIGTIPLIVGLVRLIQGIRQRD